MTSVPRPLTGMTRTVPGWLWLQGKEVQDREWFELEVDFWGYISLNLWEVALIRKWLVANEKDRTVILHMEAEVFGKIVPGSLRISGIA
jgi:hypothetical protein